MVWVFGLNIHWHVEGTSSFISSARDLACALWDCYHQPNVESGDTGRLTSLHTDHWLSQGSRVERGKACEVLVPGFTPKQPRQLHVLRQNTPRGCPAFGKRSWGCDKILSFSKFAGRSFSLAKLYCLPISNWSVWRALHKMEGNLSPIAEEWQKLWYYH